MIGVQEEKEHGRQTQKAASEKSIETGIKQPPAERNEAYGQRGFARQTDAGAS